MNQLKPFELKMLTSRYVSKQNSNFLLNQNNAQTKFLNKITKIFLAGQC